MSQTVFGQTDALALAVVAWLTAPGNPVLTNNPGGTSPNIADTYLPTGSMYNAQPTYLGIATGLFLWFSGSFWIVGVAVGGVESFTGQSSSIDTTYQPAQIGYEGSANGSTNAFCLPIAAEARLAMTNNLNAALPPAVPAWNEPVSVDVFPDLEISRRQGISTAFASEYSIHLYIQQQLTGASDEEAQGHLLLQLRSQIIESLKLRAFNLANAVKPVNHVFPTEFHNMDRGFRGKQLYSLERLLQEHVFESDTIVIFKAAA